MKTILKTLAVSGLVLGGAVSAQAADLSVLFANTVKMDVTLPSGSTMSSTYLYNEDGTVDITAGDRTSQGTWEIKGDQMCMTVTGPQGAQEICNPVAEMEGAAPGDTWSFSPAEGMTIDGSIVAGR